MAKTEATKASQQRSKQVTKDFAKLTKTLSRTADVPYLIGFIDGDRNRQFGWTKVPMTTESVTSYTAGWREAQKAYTKAPMEAQLAYAKKASMPRKKRGARL